MYAIKQIDPTGWQSVSTLAQFYEDLATNPYCTNEKGFSHIRTKSHAIKHAYIQPNHPNVCRWLVFDIDDPQALFVFSDKGLPRPQIIIKNPENGHAHYAYKLTKPVGEGGKSSTKALKYLSSVQHALRLALGADRSYGGNLIKNPCHNAHMVYITGAKPSYSLAELSEHLDLESYQPQEPANDEGYGRNCAVFEHVRHKAYPIAQTHSYRELERILTAIAEEYNQRFDMPLMPNELKHIIRSITKFCKSSQFGAYSAKFKEKQREDGRIGGKASNSSNGGKARSANYKDKRKQARELRKSGLSIRRIAEQMNVSKTSIQKWISV